MSFVVELFKAGYTDLIPVIPPGAQLSLASKIPAQMIGKIPGRRNSNGTWGGFDWRKHQTTLDDVTQWTTKDGASIGLRADKFPGVDIDCTDPELAATIARFMRQKLGAAPARVGRAPKLLLMYRTEEGFGRMRLWVRTSTGEHLVEILGVGQQYLVHGLHPTTQLPYKWLQEPPAASDLTLITREQANAALDELAVSLDALGIAICEREADGRATERASKSQASLLAPSLDELRAAVALIPNDDNIFPDRTSYLKMGYAIKAAAGDDNDSDGFEIFAEWCSRWDGGSNDPDVVLADWRRMNGAKSVGWNWIAEQARGYGYNDAANDFEVMLPTDDADARRHAPTPPPMYSDQWLAGEVIKAQGARLKYVPERGCFLVWAEGRWKIDAELLAEDLILQGLNDIANDLLRQGVTPADRKANMKEAKILCSSGKATSVKNVMQSNRAIAVSQKTMDHDPMLLNTPAGIITLVDGKMTPADPVALCTKSTSVAPDFSGDCPTWLRFLRQATNGDDALIGYLQRLSGYCLTGLTKEQKLTFIWGDGQNGKSVFLNVLANILGDYGATATMDTFTASNSDKHSTDIASLHGARLVTASETTMGKRWDEQRVKNLTGGEPVTARFMRQDNFTYRPQFKLVFIGNHKPELRDVGHSMKRRVQMVPFTYKPPVEDQDLGAKLTVEYPAILAWMIRGCLAWQEIGLSAPDIVKASTDDYFVSEDSVGDWMKDCVGQGAESHATTDALYQSWREWCGKTGEFVGTKKRLASTLISRGIPRWQEPGTRKMGFAGIHVVERQGLEL